MTSRLSKVASMMLLTLSTGATASLTPVEAEQASTIASSFAKTLHPSTLAMLAESGVENPAELIRVHGSVDALPQLFAVSMEGNTWFTNEAGSIAISGNVLDTTTKDNINELVSGELVQEQVEQLDMADLVVLPAMAEKTNHIYVFSDPTCSFCMKLHEHFEELRTNGVEIRVIPYIRSLWSRMSELKTLEHVQVMMEEDPLKRVALYEAMVHGDTDLESINAEDLDRSGFESILRTFEAGKRAGISGTPHIYTDTGRLFGGYVDANTIFAELGITPEPNKPAAVQLPEL